MSLALIRYVCVQPAHQQPALDDRSSVADPITIYEREWAFCPAGLGAGHEWQPISGLTIDEISLRVRMRHSSILAMSS